MSFTVGLDMPVCNNNKANSVKSHFLRCSSVDAQEPRTNTQDKYDGATSMLIKKIYLNFNLILSLCRMSFVRLHGPFLGEFCTNL